MGITIVLGSQWGDEGKKDFGLGGRETWESLGVMAHGSMHIRIWMGVDMEMDKYGSECDADV